MKVSVVAMAVFLVSLCVGTARAGEPEIVSVDAERTGPAGYRFVVTLRHDDEGWNHYADSWEVLAPGGAVLGTRILHHPHVDEQPFTRALPGVTIPADVREVLVRAHDSVHGYGETFRKRLPEQD